MVTKQAGKHVSGFATWEPSIDPEGQPVEYRVAVRGPSGGIIHESEALSSTEYTFEVETAAGETGDYQFAVTATDGVHIRRSVNTGQALIEGTATHTVEVPESFDVRSVYPQPSSNAVKVDLNVHQRGELEWDISNLIGQNLLNGRVSITTPGVSQLNLDVSDLAAGIYGLTLRIDELVERRTLIIAR